ncbi:uncharacterized protein MYCGRDRAFT_106021 [Zymoseptoria tritici IPO323]|uniref:Uncharacterized protein n=1 Tax=Zymoseptoria tritici (strain CBS 115943 / IPO323) TaxID=336722 RepID=F9XLX2_ZYMTI|nr:uncharacterized protein MYCGRDRAFT_106021 [Zymoseptoria tritici IPO323]EGP83939.1 hypothetical protein MYCGRDRAFT_106021 [Zymoseptoria tritici IPO323]
MLGTTVLFGLAALWLNDLRGTSPRSPNSIASIVGFLAGSELCDGPHPLILEHALPPSKAQQDELFNG